MAKLEATFPLKQMTAYEQCKKNNVVLNPPYTKQMSLGKTYGIKARCYWEHLQGAHWEPREHVANLMGTHWELEGNMFGINK